jgi:hypothetical protein
MVELVVKRCPNPMELGEVHHPSRVGVDRPLDRELDAKAVAMKARALVSLGDAGKAVGRLETKLMYESHVHRRSSVPPLVTSPLVVPSIEIPKNLSRSALSGARGSEVDRKRLDRARARGVLE